MMVRPEGQMPAHGLARGLWRKDSGGVWPGNPLWPDSIISLPVSIGGCSKVVQDLHVFVNEDPDDHRDRAARQKPLQLPTPPPPKQASIDCVFVLCKVKILEIGLGLLERMLPLGVRGILGTCNTAKEVYDNYSL